MSYNEQLNANNEALEAILNKVNELPNTDTMAEKTWVTEQLSNYVKASTVITITGVDADGYTRTWTVYGTLNTDGGANEPV